MEFFFVGAGFALGVNGFEPNGVFTGSMVAMFGIGLLRCVAVAEIPFIGFSLMRSVGEPDSGSGAELAVVGKLGYRFAACRQQDSGRTGEQERF